MRRPAMPPVPERLRSWPRAATVTAALLACVFSCAACESSDAAGTGATADAWGPDDDAASILDGQASPSAACAEVPPGLCAGLSRHECTGAGVCGGCLRGFREPASGGVTAACLPCDATTVAPDSCDELGPVACESVTDGDLDRLESVRCTGEATDGCWTASEAPGCGEGCVRVAFLLAYDEPVVVNELWFLSDWWAKRPNEWTLWASADDPVRGAGRKVAEGTGHAEPWQCATGEPCSEEVPDGCCPDGRDQPQRIEEGALLGKWDVARFESASGRYFWFEIESTRDPRNLNIAEVRLKHNPCEGSPCAPGYVEADGACRAPGDPGPDVVEPAPDVAQPGPDATGADVVQPPPDTGGPVEPLTCDEYCDKLDACGFAADAASCRDDCTTLETLGEFLPPGCAAAFNDVFACAANADCARIESACDDEVSAAETICGAE